MTLLLQKANGTFFSKDACGTGKELNFGETPLGFAGTQFTCFTGALLVQKSFYFAQLRGDTSRLRRYSVYLLYCCFTGTKLSLLSSTSGRHRRYSVYLLYWCFTGTKLSLLALLVLYWHSSLGALLYQRNTDAAAAAQCARTSRSTSTCCLLSLLVQEYKY